MGKVTNADKIKGGKEDDALTFDNSVTDSSVYGGKGNDTFEFKTPFLVAWSLVMTVVTSSPSTN